MLVADPHLNDLTGAILGAAIEVHRVLGPGLLESVYQACFQYELSARGLRFVAQYPVAIVYKSMPVHGSYRIDLIVEDQVVVEVKSVAALAPVYKAQLITYVRLTGHHAGLLINFNVTRLMDGVQRVINSRSVKP